MKTLNDVLKANIAEMLRNFPYGPKDPHGKNKVVYAALSAVAIVLSEPAIILLRKNVGGKTINLISVLFSVLLFWLTTVILFIAYSQNESLGYYSPVSFLISGIAIFLIGVVVIVRAALMTKKALKKNDLSKHLGESMLFSNSLSVHIKPKAITYVFEPIILLLIGGLLCIYNFGWLIVVLIGFAVWGRYGVENYYKLPPDNTNSKGIVNRSVR